MYNVVCMWPVKLHLSRPSKGISRLFFLEKTAHRASIIDEIHLTLTISRYQKVSSLLREKEEVNTTIASRHADGYRCKERLIEAGYASF